MALPEITFDSPEEELKYGVKVLIEAGLSPQDIEKIRDRHKPGQSLGKEMIGYGVTWCKSYWQQN